MSTLERTLLWIIFGGIFLILFTPLVVAQQFFFPFITGKAFFFRIITELISGVWVALILLYPKYRPQKSPIFITLLLFIASITLSTVFGINPYHSFWSNFERMDGLITYLHILMLFLIIAHSFKNKEMWFLFFNISVGVSVIVAIHGFFQKTGVIEILGGGRPFAAFGNSIYLAVYLLFHLFILAILFCQVRLVWLKALYAILFLFEFFVFFTAASRGAFVGFSAGLFIISLLFILFSKNKISRLIGASIISLLLLIGVMIMFFPKTSFVQSNQIFSRLSSVSIKDLSDNPRIMIWGIGWKAFQERPLLGWGPENFTIPYAKYYNPNLYGNEPWFDRVHNMPLEWLVATGLIGFILYLSIFVSTGFVLLKLLKRKEVDKTFSIFITGLFVAYIVQDIFVFDSVLTLIFVMSILGYLHYLYIQNSFMWPKGKAQKNYQPITTIFAAGAVVFSLFIIFFLNVHQIRAASQVITALNSMTPGNSVEKVLGEFNKGIAYNTFGTTEIRERVANLVVQYSTNIDQFNEAYGALLNYSIQEMEKEVSTNPGVARHTIFLGKLYTVKANYTGEGFENGKFYYDKTLELAPNYIQAYLGLSELYLIRGESEKAVKISRQAFSLLDNDALARSSLFYPTLSVYILAGDFQEGAQFLREFRESVGTPVIGPISEELDLLIKRAQRSRDVEGRLFFFKELNNIFIEDYGFPDPRVLAEIVGIYNYRQEFNRAKEVVVQYWNDETKKNAGDYTDKLLRESENPKEAQIFVNNFYKSFEVFP